MTQVIEREEEEESKHLASIKTKASKEGIDCETITVHGEEPYQEIIDTAAKNGRHDNSGQE